MTVEQELRTFHLPDVGEGLTEAEVVTWRVGIGDQVALDDVIVEIETAKSVVELPSPHAGTVIELLVQEGETAPVGSPLLTIGTPSDGAAAPSPAGHKRAGDGDSGTAATSAQQPPADVDARAEPDTSPHEVPERVPVLVGYGVSGSNGRRRRITVPSGAGPDPAHVGATDTGDASATRLATPPVRALAKQLGVDLRTIARRSETVSRDDVLTLAASVTDSAELDNRVTRIPVRGVRKATAATVSRSAFSAPHVSLWVTVDITETMNVVRRLRGSREWSDVRVNPLLMVARALLFAVRKHPGVNATWDENAQEIVVKHFVNLGIAVATERGLVVPNIKDAHAMSIPDLGVALAQCIDRTRNGKARPEDLSGGTITITNIGSLGVDGGTPILNSGEGAILAFGAVRESPWVVDGELRVRETTTLAMSFDHRHIDGELGAQVLTTVAELLERPADAFLIA